MQNIKIGFIGTGNMANALAKGILDSAIIPNQNLFMGDRNKNKLETWQNIGAKTSTDISQVFLHSDIVFLAIKPQSLPEVSQQLKNALAFKAERGQKTLIISILAGISLARLQSIFGDLPIVRVMPNLPASIGCGVSAGCINSKVSNTDKNFVEQILQTSGICIWVEENKIDAITALSGSGPAYFYYILEIMQKSAQKLGFNAQTAEKLVLQTALGAIKQAMASDENVSQLKQKVTSKGGTTFAALQVFENQGLEKVLDSGIDAAFQRARELGKENS